MNVEEFREYCLSLPAACGPSIRRITEPQKSPHIDAETFAVPSDQHSNDEMDDRISIHAFHEECDNLSGVMRLSEVTRGYPEPTRAQMPQNGEKLVFSSSRLNKIFILFNLAYRLKASPSCGYRWHHGSRQAGASQD